MGKYKMNGMNIHTGSCFEIEFSNPKLFSSKGLREMLLVPSETRSETLNDIRHKHKGANDFISYLANEVKLGAKELDDDIVSLERKLIQNIHKTGHLNKVRRK